MEITRIFDILTYANRIYQDKKDFLVSKIDKKWVEVSIGEYYATASKLSYGLMAMGLGLRRRI